MTSTAEPFWKRIALRDLACGAIVSGFGLLVVYFSQAYRMGNLMQMGPGFFPATMGFLLCGLGIAITALEPMQEKVPALPLRPMLSICAGVMAFALTIEWLGLVVAVMSSMLLSSLALPESKIAPAVLTAGLMAAACVAVFDWGLGLQLRAFG